MFNRNEHNQIKQHVVEMIQKFSSDQISRLVQPVRDIVPPDSTEYELKRCTIAGQHGAETDEE